MTITVSVNVLHLVVRYESERRLRPAVKSKHPLRPISGYFAGQASTPCFGIVASVFALRKELSVKAEPYWNRDVLRRVARFATFTAIGSAASGCPSSIRPPTTWLRASRRSPTS